MVIIPVGGMTEVMLLDNFSKKRSQEDSRILNFRPSRKAACYICLKNKLNVGCWPPINIPDVNWIILYHWFLNDFYKLKNIHTKRNGR